MTGNIQTTALSLYSSEFGFVTCFTKHELYKDIQLVDFLCLTPLSAIFQLSHGDQF